MPSPRLGPLASLAALLPQRGRMLRAALVIVALFLSVVGVGKLAEEAGRPGIVLVQAAMILLGLMLFGLIVLLQWRTLAGFAGLPDADHIPRLWRLFLLPYPRRDIAEMMVRGRLAELMTLSMMTIIVLGLLLAVTLPRTP